MSQDNDQNIIPEPSEQHEKTEDAASRQDSDEDQDKADDNNKRQSSDLSRTKSNVSIAEQMSPMN